MCNVHTITKHPVVDEAEMISIIEWLLLGKMLIECVIEQFKFSF